MATTTERRRYKRYCASGQADFWTTLVMSVGKLLDVAEGPGKLPCTRTGTTTS